MFAKDAQNNDPVQDVTGTVTLVSEGEPFWVQNISFSSKGRVVFAVPSSGKYKVVLSSPEFLTAETEVTLSCSGECLVTEYVIMSRHLQPGETRIIMNWQNTSPLDIDLYVMAVNKTDNSTCKIWYGNKGGCQAASQDRDNADGGPNGAEIVTLTDKDVNSEFTHIVAIEDYEFENGGHDFLHSGAAISVQNEVQSVSQALIASTISQTADYYLFGCVQVQTGGNFTFIAAPPGTFFDGTKDSKWIEIMINFC